MDSPYILDVNESVDDYLQVVPRQQDHLGRPVLRSDVADPSNALNASTKPGASASSVAYYYTGNLSLAGRTAVVGSASGKVPWFALLRQRGRHLGRGLLRRRRVARARSGTWSTSAASWARACGPCSWTPESPTCGTCWPQVRERHDPANGGITCLPPVTDAVRNPGFVARDRCRLGPPEPIGPGPGPGERRLDPVADRYDRDRRRTGTASTGHAYEFRVSARRSQREPATVDRRARPIRQRHLAIGGFASVATDGLNVRSGAGTCSRHWTSWPSAIVLRSWWDRSTRVAMTGTRSSSASGSGLPRTTRCVGWSAAAGGGTPYLVPARRADRHDPCPSDHRIQRRAAPVQPQRRRRARPVTTVRFAWRTRPRLPVWTSSNSAGTDRSCQPCRSGPLSAGPQSATWDGRLATGNWAPECVPVRA